MNSHFSPRTIIVTGGAGFIGSNLIRWVLEHDANVRVINLDLLTYAGNLESLSDVEQRYGANGEGRYRFVRGDIRDADVVTRLLASGMHEGDSVGWVPDAILHLAAESHVDRSISGPAEFVSTNVQGTLNLLACMRAELASSPRPFRFVNVSTDEVYGSLGPHDAPFTELTPIAPNSPYSASKAGADCLVRAFRETFGLPCLTTRCSNNYGPYQFPEKLIPLMITRAFREQTLPVYGDGMNIRDWLHVRDHASAIWAVCTRGDIAHHVYNIGGNSEVANIHVVKAILDALGKPHSLIGYVTDRLGHDRRYAMDISFIQEQLEWSPSHNFLDGLSETVQWYVNNETWWSRVETEEYKQSRVG